MTVEASAQRRPRSRQVASVRASRIAYAVAAARSRAVAVVLTTIVAAGALISAPSPGSALGAVGGSAGPRPQPAPATSPQHGPTPDSAVQSTTAVAEPRGGRGDSKATQVVTRASAAQASTAAGSSVASSHDRSEMESGGSDAVINTVRAGRVPTQRPAKRGPARSIRHRAHSARRAGPRGALPAGGRINLGLPEYAPTTPFGRKSPTASSAVAVAGGRRDGHLLLVAGLALSALVIASSALLWALRRASGVDWRGSTT